MSDTKHTPGNVRVGTIARIIKKGMNYGQIAWDIAEAVDEAIGVDAELAKVKAERDEMARYIVEDLRDYVQEVHDDHIQKFGINYRPERTKYYQDELAKIDRIKAGQL